jgi:hypothetical protein
VFWINNSDSTQGVEKNLFQVEEFKLIDRVEMKSSSHEVVLKFADNRWRVDDQYAADRNMVDVLFATMQQAEPKRPVAASMQDSKSRVLDRDGVLVSLYEGTELKKEFIAGGNPQRSQAYFKNIGETTPYIMVIPGYRVYTSGILELDANGWRDKYIFTLNWQNSFKRLEATFPDPKKDFAIVMENRLPVIEGMAAVDTAKLYTFLDDVSLLTADEFTSNAYSALIGVPLVKIEIKDIAGRSYSVGFYPRQPQSSQFPGKVHGADAALFESGKVERIYKPRQFFELRE